MSFAWVIGSFPARPRKAVLDGYVVALYGVLCVQVSLCSYRSLLRLTELYIQTYGYFCEYATDPLWLKIFVGFLWWVVTLIGGLSDI